MRILYFMHIHWRWIKQRPHFVAEYLGRHFDVAVYYRRLWRSRHLGLVRNVQGESLPIHELQVFPRQQYPIIHRVNAILIKLQLLCAAKRADIIWLTFPSLYAYVDDLLSTRALLIYDCMDDALEFPDIRSSERLYESVSVNERKLMKRADLVFVSSETLRKKLIQRYGGEEKITVVNNAISLQDFISANQALRLPHVDRLFASISAKKIVYVGSISEWVDFDLIEESLDRQPDIVYIFVGPVSTAIPARDRLLSLPAVEHKYVPSIMAQADALVLPFRWNNLVLSVNPVKMYEYIYSCVPVIALEYQEMNQFADYVYTYRSNQEYHALVGMLAVGNLPLKRTCRENQAFIDQHTWDRRANDMVGAIMHAYRARMNEA